jgi:hypothetical protein
VGGKGGKAKKQATGKAHKPTLATKLAAAKPPPEKVPTDYNTTVPIEASDVAEGRTSPEVIVIDSTTTPVEHHPSSAGGTLPSPKKIVRRAHNSCAARCCSYSSGEKSPLYSLEGGEAGPSQSE